MAVWSVFLSMTQQSEAHESKQVLAADWRDTRRFSFSSGPSR